MRLVLLCAIFSNRKGTLRASRHSRAHTTVHRRSDAELEAKRIFLEICLLSAMNGRRQLFILQIVEESNFSSTISTCTCTEKQTCAVWMLDRLNSATRLRSAASSCTTIASASIKRKDHETLRAQAHPSSTIHPIPQTTQCPYAAYTICFRDYASVPAHLSKPFDRPSHAALDSLTWVTLAT